MELVRMLVDLEIALDSANLTWAHGILLGLTCVSLLAVSVNRWLRWNHPKNRVEKLTMLKVEVPFAVTLEDDGNVVTVKSSVVNRIEIYWDFYLDQFNNALNGQWCGEETIMNKTMCGALVTDSSEKVEKCFFLDQNQVYKNSIPRPYFLVALVVRNLKKALKPREILALITVYDVGDPSVTNSGTTIIARYLKLGSGKLTPLQRFYASGLYYQDCTTDLCVVCRDSPVTRVVLPCRHACYCSDCFDRVLNCSMCTAQFKSYFCIEPAVDDID